jgi:lysozyme
MINQAGIELIKRWEGCELKAYKDVAGVWTVGYGLTSGAGFIEVGPDTVLTQEEADWYLEQVVDKFAADIKPFITAEINENQFAAFVSLAYNVGVGGFKKSSALRHFNAGNLDKVPAAMRMWNKAGGKTVKGLINRREAEIQLFLTPVTAVTQNNSKNRSTPAQSKTVQASVVQGASAFGGVVGAFNALEGNAQLLAIGGCLVIAGLSLFILRERLKAWANGWK